MTGQRLGHYRILAKIGAGGIGEVYRAHDEHLDRDVPLKILLTGTLADEAALRRLRKEALALSRLSHSNIATVFDFDTQDGVDFLGTSLSFECSSLEPSSGPFLKEPYSSTTSNPVNARACRGAFTSLKLC